MTEQIKMDIYNFDETSKVPPTPEEPTRRDGYKWSTEQSSWIVDASQSQTKRFEIMYARGDGNITMSDIFKERQLDGYVQRLEERKAAEKLANS